MQEKHGCGGAILSTHCLNPEEHPWFRQVGFDQSRPLVFLTQRGMTAPIFPGYWAMPAGLREEDETPEQAAAREVKEEVGIDFHPEQLLFEGMWENRKLSYFLGGWNAPARLAIQESEVSGYGWFSFTDALNLPLAVRYREVIGLLAERFR